MRLVERGVHRLARVDQLRLNRSPTVEPAPGPVPQGRVDAAQKGVDLAAAEVELESAAAAEQVGAAVERPETDGAGAVADRAARAGAAQDRDGGGGQGELGHPARPSAERGRRGALPGAGRLEDREGLRPAARESVVKADEVADVRDVGADDRHIGPDDRELGVGHQTRRVQLRVPRRGDDDERAVAVLDAQGGPVPAQDGVL